MNKTSTIVKTNSLGYSFGKLLCIAVCMLVVLISCSKTSTDVTPILPAPPPATITPSGDIQTFTLNDTLVAYNAGSSIKWLISGANSLTVVTFNGVKVALYGVLDTGPIKQVTQYTLAVNSGKQATLTLKVADSLASLMWNGGKHLIQTEAEVYRYSNLDSLTKWRDTTITARVADQRIFFNLDGTSKVIQATPSLYGTPPASGKFVTINTITPPAFTWQNILFTIVTLDSKSLIVTYNAPLTALTNLPTRITYQYE